MHSFRLVPEIKLNTEQAISVYNQVATDSEFLELERRREIARHNEASALRQAREQADEQWRGVVAEKDAENEKLRKQNVGKDAQIATKDEEIARLRLQLQANSKN